VLGRRLGPNIRTLYLFVVIDGNTVRTVLEVIGGVGGSLVLLLPGWLLIAVYSRGTKGPDLPDRAYILQIAFAGMFVHIAASPWTYWLIRRLLADPTGQAIPTVGWVAGVVVGMPVAFGLGFGYLADLGDAVGPQWLRGLAARMGISSAVRTSAAWTMAFRTLQKGVFVRVRRDDGTLILGRFGPGSLASSDPARKDLFREELWSADEDGWFHEMYPGSAGIWVAGDDIHSIEFYSGVD